MTALNATDDLLPEPDIIQHIIPTGRERAEQERQRANRLRALGIDPEA
jgi:hypothetical protein